MTPKLTEDQKRLNRWGIAKARASLHRSPLPSIEQHQRQMAGLAQAVGR